ncbi:MAG TPA: GDSL-type esterase/lipase family protein [Methylibium sp.]|nr:GDSL-type esterase/lipase family protein [Methylibium sp.]
MNASDPIRRRLLLAAGTAALLAGCGRRAPKAARLPDGARVLALGDSLTFGQGAAPEQAWPAQLAARSGWTVVNAGLNGDTAAGAQARLGPLLAAERYDAVLVGIGGNDMLRGLPREQTVAALRALLRAAQAHTAHVGLLATPAPAALRAALGRLSDAPFYAELADEEGVLLLPDLYAEVLSDAALRSDTIHANAAGYARIAERLAALLREAGWR